MSLEDCVVRFQHDVGIRGLAFSANQRFLAAMVGAVVHLWDLSTQKLVHRFGSPGRDYVWSMAFSPDGRRLATASWDEVLRIWDVSSATLIHQFDWKLGRVHAVAIAPDGMTAAVGGADPDIMIWDIE